MGLASMPLDAGNKIPPMRIRGAKVQECTKTGPGPYVCLVGDNLHFDGGLGKFHRMTMGLDPDANGNIPTQAEWEFVKGGTAIPCQKLDRRINAAPVFRRLSRGGKRGQAVSFSTKRLTWPFTSSARPLNDVTPLLVSLAHCSVKLTISRT